MVASDLVMELRQWQDASEPIFSPAQVPSVYSRSDIQRRPIAGPFAHHYRCHPGYMYRCHPGYMHRCHPGYMEQFYNLICLSIISKQVKIRACQKSWPFGFPHLAGFSTHPP
jgi:hypothetical protein